MAHVMVLFCFALLCFVFSLHRFAFVCTEKAGTCYGIVFHHLNCALGFLLILARDQSGEGYDAPEIWVPRAGPQRPSSEVKQRQAKQLHAKPRFPKPRQGSPWRLFSKAKQSKAKQSKAKLSKAKQSKAKQSKAKESKAKQSKAKQSKAKQSKVK